MNKVFASDRNMIKIEEQEIILAQSFLTYLSSQIKLNKSLEQACLESIRRIIERNLSTLFYRKPYYLHAFKRIESEIMLAQYASEDIFAKLSELFSVYTLRSAFSTLSNLSYFDYSTLLDKIDTLLKLLKLRLTLLKERELTIKTSQFRFIFLSIITSLVLGLLVSLAPLLTLFYIKTIFTFTEKTFFLSRYSLPFLFTFTVGFSYLYVLLKIFKHFFSQRKMIIYTLANLLVYLLAEYITSSYLQLVLSTVI